MKRNHLSAALLVITLCILLVIVFISVSNSSEGVLSGHVGNKMAGLGVGNGTRAQPATTLPFLPFEPPGGLRVVPQGQTRDLAFVEKWDQSDGGYTLLEVTPFQWEWLKRRGCKLAAYGNVADHEHPGELPVLCRGNGKDIYWMVGQGQRTTNEVSPPLFYVAVRTNFE